MARARRPTTARVPGGRGRKSLERHELAGAAFTLPFVGLFLAVFVAPLLYALYLSLFREQLLGGSTFVGLDNFAEGLKDEAFLSGIGRVGLFMLVQVPVMLGLALVFALIIDSGRVRFAGFFRLAIFVPYAVPTVIAALMWGLPLRARLRPPHGCGRHARDRDTELPRRGDDPVVDRQRLDVDVHRPQHDRLPDRPAGRAGGALRGRGGGRRRRAAHGAVREAPAAAPCGPGVHDLLGDRRAPAVRGAADLRGDRPAGHRQVVHAEPLRLQPGVRRPAPELRGRALLPAGRRRVRRLVPRRVRVPPSWRPAVSAPAAARRASRRSDRGAVLPTLFLLAFLVYFAVPLAWLVLASTKSLDDLFSSFGLWFAHFNLLDNVAETFSAEDGVYWSWLRNTLMYSGVAAVGAALLSVLAGYGFAMFDFTGKQVLFWCVLGSVMVPTTALAIPTYLMFSRLG